MSKRYYASFTGCIYLSAADIGVGEDLEGNRVFFGWGNEGKADKWKNTPLNGDFAKEGQLFSPVIPAEFVEQMHLAGLLSLSPKIEGHQPQRAPLTKDEFKRQRKAMGLTQRQLGQKLGYSVQGIRNIEAPEDRANSRPVPKWAKYAFRGMNLEKE